MTFGITATFPLGTYSGHFADGRPEPLPDPARLHAALLCSAALGPRSEVSQGHSVPAEADVRALEWLERHPPHAIARPECRPLSPAALTAYRKEGVVRVEVKEWKDKVVSRAMSDGTALAGPIGWIWDDEVPADVQESLTELCADVVCLGETESPVVLRVEALEPTLVRDPDATPFDVGSVEVRVSDAGRTSTLIEAHHMVNGRLPSVAADRHATSELPAPSRPPGGGLTTARYRDVAAPNGGDAPWSDVLLLPISKGLAVPPEGRVRFAVAVHRALIGRVGTGASPEITGAYEPGAPRPTNRLAIHYLPESIVAGQGQGDRAAIAFLIPAGMSQLGLDQIACALRGWTHVGAGHRFEVDSSSVPSIQATKFWNAPAAGATRLWVPLTPAVPETRSQRTDGLRWTLRDAALVSVGMVYRDRLNLGRTRGAERYAAMRDQVQALGGQVGDLTQIATDRPRDYAHAVPEGLVVQPYRAVLSLGSLHQNSTLLAIGQSRHLGGGLLVPFDTVAPEAHGIEVRHARRK